MQVPAIIFPDNQTAVAQMPNCRTASALRDFFYGYDFNMKRQNHGGTLTLQVPEAPNDAHLTKVKTRMRELFTHFCEQNNIEITA